MREILESEKITIKSGDIIKHIDDLKQESRKPEIQAETETLESLKKISDSENIEKDYKEQGFGIKDGKYYILVTDKKNISTEIDVSNFVMRSMYNLTNGTNNSSRLIFVQRKSRKKDGNHEKKLIEVRSSELKPEAFETILKSHGCTFLGNAYTLKKIFAYLMDEEDTAVIISLLGWNNEYQFYACADAVITIEGEIKPIDNMGVIKQDGNVFYLPAFGVANQTNEDYENDRSFRYQPGRIDFQTWAKLYYQASDHNAIPGILYSIMATFRDMIYKQLGFFPFLYLFGEKGTGKTSFIHPLLYLYGSDNTGTPLNNATIVALNRLVSSRTNSLFYFKEYTTDTDSMAESFILSGYDGAGRETGIKSNDTKTKKFPIRSGIIFDGNTMPRKSNILSRMILLKFENTKFSDSQIAAFDELREIMKYGFGRVLRQILVMRPEFQKNLRSEFAKSKKIIQNAISKNNHYEIMSNADERVLQHTYLLYTIYNLSKQHLTFPFPDEVVLDTIVQMGGNMMNLLNRTDSVTVFWESLAYNINKSYVSELNFVNYQPTNKKVAVYWIKDGDTDAPVILIKFQQLYPLYVKYCKENSIRFLDNNSLLSILTSENNKSFVHGNQKGRGKAQTVKYFGSSYQFKMTKRKDKNDGALFLNGVEFQ